MPVKVPMGLVITCGGFRSAIWRDLDGLCQALRKPRYTASYLAAICASTPASILTGDSNGFEPSKQTANVGRTRSVEHVLIDGRSVPAKPLG